MFKNQAASWEFTLTYFLNIIEVYSFWLLFFYYSVKIIYDI